MAGGPGALEHSAERAAPTQCTAKEFGEVVVTLSDQNLAQLGRVTARCPLGPVRRGLGRRASTGGRGAST
jgi:hypothetical protein